jgi:hypothetical protein
MCVYTDVYGISFKSECPDFDEACLGSFCWAAHLSSNSAYGSISAYLPRMAKEPQAVNLPIPPDLGRPPWRALAALIFSEDCRLSMIESCDGHRSSEDDQDLSSHSSAKLQAMRITVNDERRSPTGGCQHEQVRCIPCQGGPIVERSRWLRERRNHNGWADMPGRFAAWCSNFRNSMKLLLV